MSRSAEKTRLKPGNKTALVWQIADRLAARDGVLPSGRAVVDLYVAEGGNEGTGFTQYSHWKKARGRDGAIGNAAPATDMASTVSKSVRLKIAPDGRLVVPAAIRAQMKLYDDGVVTAWLDDGELRIISPRVAIERIQQMVRTHDRGSGSPVDELIAERRAEAQREDAA